MKILSLNCQKNYHPDLGQFLQDTLKSEEYDFLLLQEATEKVLNYTEGHEYYEIVKTYEDSRPGLVSVVYDSRNIEVDSVIYELWPHLHVAEIDQVNGHVSFGVVIVSAIVDSQKIYIGSVHLPSGIKKQNRTICLEKLKSLVEKLDSPRTIVIGGDCNFVYPGEIQKADQVLAPLLQCITAHAPPTLDSYYSEYVDHLPNKVACFLQRFGVHLRFKTDHFFVDTNTNSTHEIETRVLQNRVSDHSPIELNIK